MAAFAMPHAWAMQRLPFRLPDFTRIDWVSEEAREIWAPKVAKSQQLLARLELQSVVRGLRQCALLPIPLADLDNVRRQMAEAGLTLRELYRFALGQGYSSEIVNSDAAVTTAMCAVGSATVTATALDHHTGRRSRDLGALLGYPSCCTDFFTTTWERNGFIDTLWPMSLQTRNATAIDETHVELEARPDSNLFLKSLGVRPVLHLPCSCDCASTASVAKSYRKLADSLHCEREIDDLYQMLDWPLRWSALHGISEIETPVCRVSTKTDATGIKYTVDKVNGEANVAGAAVGTRFPFRTKVQMGLRGTRRADTALANKARRIDGMEYEPWYYRDNGFSSRYFMEQAFRPIMDTVLDLTPRIVFYWVCRNGALLREMRARNSDLMVYGVDPDVERIGRARFLVPPEGGTFYTRRVDDLGVLDEIPAMDVSLFMIGRLEEMEAGDAAAILRKMFDRSRTVLTYAHRDWLAGRDIQTIAGGFGLHCRSVVNYGGAIAQIVPAN